MVYYLYIENDVWGNKKEGYDVNNSVLTNCCLKFKDDLYSDKLLLNKLKKAGIIKKGIHLKSLDIQGDMTSLYLTCKEYPFGSLIRVNPGEMITFTNMHREFKPENFDCY